LYPPFRNEGHTATISVTKADGTKQPYRREKIVNLCLKMHAPLHVAERVADKLEERIYDGIETKEILRIVFSYLRYYQPTVRYQIDLRRAISLLRSKPDFERFIQLLLQELGYKVLPNLIVKGRCVEYEIDSIAIKGEETVLVEVKHHLDYHTYTGLDVCRNARATYEDLTEGYSLGFNRFNITKAIVVSNTKFSEHAIQYANCRSIACIGWKFPVGKNLGNIIEEKRLYPITILKSLKRNYKEKLADNGIVLLNQLTMYDIDELQRKTKVPKEELKKLINESKEIY